jgi:hypothetical protein
LVFSLNLRLTMKEVAWLYANVWSWLIKLKVFYW